MQELLTFLAGAAIGGLLSWLITHRYYIKAGSDQKAELARLSDELKPKNTLQNFEQLLEKSTWSKSVIGHSEVWMADIDNTYQIESGESLRDFTESWTTMHPDPNSSAHGVYLKLNGTTIKELTFIAMDGGRIFVPMASVRPKEDGSVEYFWNLNSLEVKVCRIVGTYYRYENLEGLAESSNVTIVA